MAKAASISAPQLQTLYPLLCHLNTINQIKTTTNSSGVRDRQSAGFENTTSTIPAVIKPPPMSIPDSQPSSSGPRVNPNQKVNHAPKRPQSSVNGRNLPNGDAGRSQVIINGPYGSRRNSFDNDLEEFGHIVMYGDMLHTDDTDDLVLAGNEDKTPVYSENHHRQHLSIREREFQLRQRELALKEQELALQRNARISSRRKGPRPNNHEYDEDEEDDDEYFSQHQGPSAPHMHPDNIDMMSVTSRRNRRLPSGNGLRGNFGNGQPHRISFSAKGRNKDRASAALIGDFPTPHSSIADDPLLNYSSNRYPTLQSSRANSLTTPRFDDYAGGGTNSAYPSMPSRRASATPPYAGGHPPMVR
ncbi:hypothetical protein H072_5627 [Dactylellina haptotyla CBS 200.50]|uniref:Uncharacterized protein n=1 Tax=Dactylellina haptotyla (strain CBS 200.50) TaxID=1284197 RepID=S8AC21_DACHA|nr:hypothetical protein H072_5627 [Dactylellina haptotyla CBS 200.50]